MAVATLHEWKQFMEGMRRGDVGPYVQSLRSAGINRIREYHRQPGNQLRSFMLIEGAAINNPNLNVHANPRQFDIHTQDMNATAYIYIPTDQEYEDWGDAGLDFATEIANREPVI